MADEKELLEQLRDIVRQRDYLDLFEQELVRSLREIGWQGVRWDVIGEALGISRQAAMKRHAQRLADEAEAEGNDRWRHRRRWDAGRPQRSR